MMNWKDAEGSGQAQCKVMSQLLYGGTEENHKTPQ